MILDAAGLPLRGAEREIAKFRARLAVAMWAQRPTVLDSSGGVLWEEPRRGGPAAWIPAIPPVTGFGE